MTHPPTWDEAFSERYEQWSAAMTADIAFYIELAREADGPLVELAVGNGRVAVPVAQATGRVVVGIDTSPGMLAQARANAAAAVHAPSTNVAKNGDAARVEACATSDNRIPFILVVST